MRIYTSARERKSWLIQPYRGVERGVGAESVLASKISSEGYSSISILSQNDSIFYGLSDEEGLLDFGLHFQYYCNELGCDNAIYIEHAADNLENVLFVVVIDGELKQDRIGEPNSVYRDLFVHLSNTQSEVSVLFFHPELMTTQSAENYIHGLISDDVASLGSDLKLEVLQAALTDTLTPRTTMSFISTHDALAELSNRRPWLLYLLVVVSICVALFFIVQPNSDDVPQQVNTLDPYASFYAAMRGDVVEVLNRMNQDYNTHVGLMTLPGWNVERVSHTKGQVSYTLLPTPDAELINVKAFAAKQGMHVIVEQGSEVTLLAHGANTTPYNSDDDVELFNVVDIHHFLNDAVFNFMPNASLEFIRDVPKGGGVNERWVIRELELRFRGIFKEDLLLLGSITKDLPISIGGDNSDPMVGQYVAHEERFTGGLKISIFGEKQ